MEHEILDSPLKEPSTKHSKQSFKLCLWTIGLLGFTILINNISTLWFAGLPSNLIDMLFGLPAIAMLITSMGGLRHSIKSIQKNEPWVYQKVIGLSGALFFVGIILILIFENVLDVVNAIS